MKNLYLILLLACTLASSGQVLQIAGSAPASGGISTFYNDTVDDILWANGSVTSADGQTIDHIMYWDGSSWTPTGNISNLITGSGLPSLFSMVRANDTLWAIGAIKDISYLIELVYWDGTDWAGTSQGSGFTYDGKMLVNFNNTVYMTNPMGCRHIDSSNTANVDCGKVGYWTGSEFANANYPGSCEVYDIIVWNGKLYASDQCFDGTNWTTYGLDLQNCSVEVNQFAEHNNELVIATTDGKIQTYDGTSFTTICNYIDHEVRDMCSFGNYLVICGNFDTINSSEVKEVGLWDGTTWTGIAGLGGNVNTVGSYNDQLLLSTPEGYPIWNVSANMGTIALYGPAVGIEENKITEFEIFPNPTNNKLNIQLNREDEYIEIFNSQGQLVYIESFSIITNHETKEIDISYLPKALYIIKVTGENIVRVAKVVKN